MALCILKLKFNKDNETICVMFYFKESRETKYLYELELTSDMSDSTEIKKYLENIASTVRFKK